MFNAEVVEYHLPNGRRSMKCVSMGDEYRDAYDSMRAAGCWFEMETFRNGERCVTIFSDEGDIEMIITPGDVSLDFAIGKLLNLYSRLGDKNDLSVR